MSYFPPGRKQIEWYAVTVQDQPLSDEAVWRETLALESARVGRWSGTRPLSLAARLLVDVPLPSLPGVPASSERPVVFAHLAQTLTTASPPRAKCPGGVPASGTSTTYRLRAAAELVVGLGIDRDRLESPKAILRRAPVAWASIEGRLDADGDG